MKHKILLALAFGLASCGATDAEPEINQARSTKQRVTAPIVAEAELETAVLNNTTFALDLLKHIGPEGSGNIVYSPHSISTALAMAYAGARGNTETVMASTLHFELDQSALHPAFNLLDLKLADRGQNKRASDGTPFKLKIVNALWLQDGARFESGFLDTLAVNYGAGVNLLDFINDTEASRETINEWVEFKTASMIKDLLPEGSITEDSRVVLTNAIYFNAAWKYDFPASSRTGAFTLGDGTEVDVPMMSQLAFFKHTENDAFHTLEMPYDGDEVSMVVLVPKAGTVQDLENSLTAPALNQAIAELEGKRVRLTLPKFKFEMPFSLGTTLQALGMGPAFTRDADFTGITTEFPLLISDVIHKAMINVNEKGTEAAAATAVVGTIPVSTPEVDLNLHIDRPFLFMIRDIETSAILFIGRVADPR